MNREAIYSALFALVSTTPDIVVKSRRLRAWADVSPAEQPALFMSQTGESAVTQTNQPTRWFLNVELYLYAHTQNSQSSPASIINPLLDAITAKISPSYGENQTLGGLVQYCRISGAIETDEGVLGDQAVAIIPIEILTT